MSKIQTIHLHNFKAISDLQMDFNGMTAIITGRNNSGKSSFLRGIVDRIRFIRPDIPVKQGQVEGKGELTLDSGERFVWEFSEAGRDKLTYITTEGRQSVTKELGAQFFPETFDIDRFLQSSPKDQIKQLQKIVGLDFTDINSRYQKAYDFRTERNREAELYQAKLTKALKCEPVSHVDLTSLKAEKEAERKRLNDLYLKNKQANEAKRTAWENEKEVINRDCAAHNEEQDKAKKVFDSCFQAMLVLKSAGFSGGDEFIDSLRDKIKPLMVPAEMYPKEPEYIQEMPSDEKLQAIDERIYQATQTNALAAKYREYLELKESTEAAKGAADDADAAVKAIEDERKRMIESAKFPEGLSIGHDGITVDGFQLDKTQISTSKLYCAALKIASINLGEVRTLYFDASFLDRNTLAEIQAWANNHDLQLLIERPDYEAGDIKYELIEG